MRKAADLFHHRMRLEPEESIKAFLFVVKALAAMGFVFVYGQVASTGEVSSTASLVLALAAVLDIVPEVFTVRILGVLPERAVRAEKLQLLLKAVAYLVLLSIFVGTSVSTLWSYTAFVVLWLSSFLVEESVMFLLEDADDR